MFVKFFEGESDSWYIMYFIFLYVYVIVSSRGFLGRTGVLGSLVIKFVIWNVLGKTVLFKDEFVFVVYIWENWKLLFIGGELGV